MIQWKLIHVIRSCCVMLLWMWLLLSLVYCEVRNFGSFNIPLAPFQHNSLIVKSKLASNIESRFKIIHQMLAKLSISHIIPWNVWRLYCAILLIYFCVYHKYNHHCPLLRQVMMRSRLRWRQRPRARWRESWDTRRRMSSPVTSSVTHTAASSTRRPASLSTTTLSSLCHGQWTCPRSLVSIWLFSAVLLNFMEWLNFLNIFFIIHVNIFPKCIIHSVKIDCVF